MNNVYPAKADFGKQVIPSEASEIKNLMEALHKEAISTNEAVNDLIVALSPVSAQDASFNTDSLPAPIQRKCPLSNELDQRLNDLVAIRYLLKKALKDLCL